MMNQQAYTLISMTALVAGLIAILVFAMLRFAAAARDSRRHLRETGMETALLSQALEDAITLAQCFRHNAEVSKALRQFETERKPVIETYQAAAEESMLWFENAKEFMQLTPIELAYVLMTRSGRIDHETLTRRDPNFIALYENRSKTKS